MIINEWLKASTQKLSENNIPTARLDVEVLLAKALDKDRSWLHAHPEHCLQGSTLYKLDEQIKRRITHEPIAYILGVKEFYGREFKVTKDTLQPRPETENIIDILKQTKPKTIIDIGTGTGCIAISAKLELPDSIVIATDVSSECLNTTKENSEILGAEITILKSDLLQDINVNDIAGSTLSCNLPYVPDEFDINESAKHEPPLALFGGVDGLDYYRQLFEEIISIPESLRPTSVITESLLEQHDGLASIAKTAGYDLAETRDLIQMFYRI